MDRFNFFQSRSPYGNDRDDEHAGQTERDRVRHGERDDIGSSYGSGARSNSGADAGGVQRQDHRQLLHAQFQHQQHQQQQHLQMHLESQSQDRNRLPSRPTSPYKSASFWDSLDLDQRMNREKNGGGHGLGLGHTHYAERDVDVNAGQRGYSYSSTERDRPSSRGAVRGGGASREARLETLGGGLRDMLAGHSTSFASSARAAGNSRAHNSQSRPESSLPSFSAPLHRAPSNATSKASPHGSYLGDIPSPLARSPAKRSAADTNQCRDEGAEEEDKENKIDLENDREKDGEDGDKGSQRSRNGCLVCRKRKVKCDETRPRCGKCAIKSRQCVWPEPGTTGNKKRRPSSTLDRPSAARPSAPSRSASRALSPKEEIIDSAAGPLGVTSTFMDGTPYPALGSRSRSQSQSQSKSQLNFEPNPLASLVGAVHASAIQDQHQSSAGGSHSNTYTATSQGLPGLQDLPKLQPRSTIVSGPRAGKGVGHLDNLPGLTGADPSMSSPTTRADANDVTDARKDKRARTGRGNKTPGEGERHRNASPGAILRPTGRASLAQILDTHESLNAARANGSAASGHGTKGSGIEISNSYDVRRGSDNSGYGQGQGLEHAIYQHQRQQGSLSQSRLSSSHPPANAQTYPTTDPQKANPASATGTGSGPISAPANTSTAGPPFSVQKGYDLGAMLDDARRGVEGRQGPSNGDIRGQPMTVEPMNLHRPPQVGNQGPGHGQLQDLALPKLDVNLDLQRYTNTNGATSGNAQAEFGHNPIVNGSKNDHMHTSGTDTLNDNMNVSGTGHMGHGYVNGYENGNRYSQNQPTTAYPGQHSEINSTFQIIPNTQDPSVNALDALHPNGMDQFNHDTNNTHHANNNMPLMETLETDWFQLLFGTTEDLASQPPPAFPPLHFQPPPLPPPTRFYVPPDFLPKHSLHDLDDSHGGEFTRVLIRDDKRAEMMADPAFLAPYFPNLDERIVIRHYLRNTVNITVAFQCPRKPWNPWITIHAPLAFNHLPGVNPAADALRAAILAVGAVHLRFTHDSSDQKGAWAIVRASKAKVLSLVRRSIDSQQATNTPMDKGDVEMILAALLSCTIASSLAADESWHELLTSVVSLVGKLGGAQALLREGRQAHIDTGTAPGMEMQQMSALRFLLEQLAVRDVFGCMTTELAPNMLNVAFSPWFFEAESWSKGDDEWESIERMFGISRGMVDVIARACMLISQVRKTGITISEDLTAEAGWGTHTKEFTLRLPSRVISRLDSAKDVKHGRDANGKRTVGISPHAILIPTPPISSSPAFSITTGLTPAASGMGPPASASAFPSESSSAAAAPASGLTRKRGISPTTALIQADILQAANGLIAELSVWDKSSNFTPFHPRTQYGNHTYRHAIRIRLLREVFMVPMDDKRVQDSVGAIVELTVELLAQYGRITWLTWPIVLAAFNMLPKDPQREVALALLNEFTYHACFDLTAARKMLCEFWEEEDMATTPGQVVKRQRVRPFLD